MLLIIYVVILILVNLILTKIYCKIRKKLISTKEENRISQELFNRRMSKKYNSSYLLSYIDGFIGFKLQLLGKVPSQSIRILLLRYVYQMNIEKNVVIYGGFEIRAPWNITIGRGSVIGNQAKLDGRNGIIIGKNVNISTGVWIWTEQHDYDDAYFRCNNKGGKVLIGDRSWLSCRTVILPNVVIGEAAVIAAGAIVTKSCQEYGVYGGCPAKKIANRNVNLLYEFKGDHLKFI